jgi:hypothetical protein
MPFNVRFYGHRGIVQGPIVSYLQDSRDSLFMLSQPYEFAILAASNGATPITVQSPFPVSSDITKILRIEIPDGAAIRYEINPQGRSVAASANSPVLTGVMQLNWAAGWSFSFIEDGLALIIPALTVVNDINVTGTLVGGTLTLGWQGTLAAGRLNPNVVQSVTNDANVTGSIAGQNLTLGWTGGLANSRLASMAAWTFKGNPTGGSAAPADFTIDGMTLKASPTIADEIMIWDVAGTAIKKATVRGGRAQRLVTASPIVIAATDEILNVNITSGSPTCALPAASTRNGVPLTFKDVGGNFTAHNLTITPTGIETIDGGATLVLNINRQGATLVPANDGTSTGWAIE